MIVVLLSLTVLIIGLVSYLRKEVKRRREEREIEIANKTLLADYQQLKRADIP
jgi:hypothetical protein